jgi:hypothetical protein
MVDGPVIGRIWLDRSAGDATRALSNFECFHARPEAETLPTGVRIVADFYFTMMPRHLPPFASESDVRTLRKTAEPGLRAAALWWAEALLAKQEAYTSVETVNPPARQWQYKPVGGRLLSKLATATNERLASDIHRPSMDGSRLDFEALSLGWLPCPWHRLSKSATLKGEKCRNERKTTSSDEGYLCYSRRGSDPAIVRIRLLDGAIDQD